MKKKSKLDTFWENLWVGLAIFTFGIPVIPIGGIMLYSSIKNPDTAKTSAAENNLVLEPSCTYEEIPYDTESEYTDDLYEGEEEVYTDGEVGEQEICVDENGSETSSTTTKEPVTEVIRIGTYVEEEEEPVYRVGAICNDGWESSATGSGACSWHGGVDYWLYNR